MGINNRARRAAKAKQRAKARSASWGSSRSRANGEPLFTQAQTARYLLLHTAQLQHRGDPHAIDDIRRLAAMPAALVDREAEVALLEMVGSLWAGGWQPLELHRQGRLGCSTAVGARLVGLAIATDHIGRRSVTLDPRWIAQVEALGLPVVSGRPGWVERWIDAEGLDRDRAVAVVVEALANVMHLPRLDPILPPPGSARPGPGAAWPRVAGAVGAEVDPILERIRALLAKAESTSFEAEATAFTAKAQELMTRHAIDSAMLQGRSSQENEQPITIRVPIDAPYADVKSLLLQTVAQAGRCRTVFHQELQLSTVVGFPADIATVEALFTSLLLQAQTALAAAAKRAPAGTRTRSQSYRSAFLLGYTRRIGDRLREINEAVYSEVEAEQGPAFLPVLRSRSATIDDVMAERFADSVAAPVRGGDDLAGWSSGAVAADNARLNFGDLIEEAPTGT